MAAFATAADLEVRWRPLVSDEQAVADARLGDASAIVRSEIPGIDAAITAGSVDAEVARFVVCEMVKRTMLPGPEATGISGQMLVAGPFTRQTTYANPTGNLYLTKQEKRLLGARPKAFTIDPTPPAADPDPLNWWELE